MENMYDSEVFSRNENPYLVDNSTNGIWTPVINFFGSEKQKTEEITKLSKILKDLELELKKSETSLSEREQCLRDYRRRGNVRQSLVSVTEDKRDENRKAITKLNKKIAKTKKNIADLQKSIDRKKR